MDLGDPAIKPIKVLGAGSFGRVFLCKYRNTHNVCVKRIIVHNPKNDMKMIMEEVCVVFDTCVERYNNKPCFVCTFRFTLFRSCVIQILCNLYVPSCMPALSTSLWNMLLTVP